MTVLAIAEHRRDELRDVSFELITAGRQLAAASDEDLHLAVIGGDATSFGTQLDRDGVDVVHTIAEGDEFNHDIMTQAVEQLVAAVDPSVLLLPHTVNGLDYAPVVASWLDWPLVTDAVAIDAADGLVATRERYGSKVETTMRVESPHAVVTIRSAEWEPARKEGTARIDSFEVSIDNEAVGSDVVGYEEASGGDVDITEADVLVSIGRGIEEEDNLDLVFDLANALDATVSASRPIVDNGWIPKNRQVGQSGKVVTPEIYLAIGISGAVQHVAGMKNADTIIAINTDPNAPIFDIADYGIVDDLFDVVPELIEAVEG